MRVHAIRFISVLDREDRIAKRSHLFRMPRVQLVATFPVGADGNLACVTPFVHDVDDSTTMGELKDIVLQRAAEEYDEVDLTAILLMVGPSYCVFGADKYLDALSTLVALPGPGDRSLRLYFSPIWTQFRHTAPTHVVLYLGHGRGDRHYLVHPPTMGLHFLEDIAEWLRSERVADYLAYTFTNKKFSGIKDRTSPMVTIGRKLEKLARSFAVLGGPNGFLLAKFTVEFEADQAAVRAALQALNPLDFPALDDFDASKLTICEPPTMASVEGALVHCLRLLQARFALSGTPFLISTEYSGEGSIGAWVEGVRNVHATLNWILDPKLISDPSSRMIHVEVDKYAKSLRLRAKQCGDVQSTMPGFKIEFNYPYCSILRWEYELKTPYAREECCLVKKEFGKGNKYGFMCAVRLWKGELHIPCGRYPTIAALHVGAFREKIADRLLPAELASLRGGDAEAARLAAGRAASKPITHLALADSLSDSQPDVMLASAPGDLPSSPCLLPLLQCIADAGLELTDAQREAAASLSEQIDEMNKDNFDVIPDDPDVDDAERELAEAGDDPVLLRKLAEKLVAKAARKREREEESD